MSDLKRYRDGLIERARSRGEQLALAVSDDYAADADAAVEHLAASGAVFTADDVVALAGPAPSTGALGAVVRSAARRGRIVAVGVAASRRLGRRGSLLREWVGSEW